MRLLLILLFALPVHAQTTISRWQDLQPYIAAQTGKLNEHTKRLNELENRYNVALHYALVQLCYANSMQTTWVGSLAGLKPFPLTGLECPQVGAPYFVPGFIGGSAAVPKPQ